MVEAETISAKAAPGAMMPILTVRALAEPGTMARITNVFAQRGIIPDFVSCRRADAYLILDVQFAAEDGVIDAVLLERVRALVCVDRADFVEARR